MADSVDDRRALWRPLGWALRRIVAGSARRVLSSRRDARAAPTHSAVDHVPGGPALSAG